MGTLRPKQIQFQQVQELLRLQCQGEQRVVAADDAEKLINEGWEYVGTLPNGKVVVKRQVLLPK